MFFDYDGTLVPQSSDVAAPIADPGLGALLRRLLEKGFSVAVVSGRPVRVLKSLVGVDEIYYAGLHGMEIEGPGIRFLHQAASDLGPVMRAVRDLAEELLEGLGVRGVVEDKGLVIGIHLGSGGRAVLEALARGIRSGLDFQGAVRFIVGRRSLEILPNVGWGKGKAVIYMISRLGLRGVPMYFGDEASDEEAFEDLRGLGVTVKIGLEGSTRAGHYLRDPGELRLFLNKVLLRI